ncbi:IclR family transcriptional regulator [Sinomonas sp. JGH33]|uniref:IclR family transcriptional regulator n=1 Tax=Sinomonas terricola TaxID=3110330 RepID=A0ABU5T8K2_9MICC|nr:IclR family transcriptional regulator [Sinomonas sp. JGH33]MEA5455918.1 IclR family transcriptional regulator [Sinomonas sp. JGH33]
MTSITDDEKSAPNERPGKTDMVGKALSLLVMLGDAPGATTAADLSRRAELPFSTAYRLLQSLQRAGFVDFEPEGKKYSLGLRVFQLGLYVSNSLGFAGTANPVLARLTEKTQEASILGVPDEDRFLTVAKVDGPKAFRVTSDPGYRGYLHCSAIGKALVAFAAPEERERLLETLELLPVAPRSITDRDEFRAEIERVRGQGYAVMDEENEVGMRAVAVPVLADSGSGEPRAIAAIACSAPTVRMTVDELVDQLPALREAAEELAARLPRH